MKKFNELKEGKNKLIGKLNDILLINSIKFNESLKEINATLKPTLNKLNKFYNRSLVFFMIFYVNINSFAGDAVTTKVNGNWFYRFFLVNGAVVRTYFIILAPMVAIAITGIILIFDYAKEQSQFNPQKGLFIGVIIILVIVIVYAGWGVGIDIAKKKVENLHFDFGTNSI